ncbi:SPOSA6832_04148 [Sporobolomyces salmonicolor]|uniref:SPOSA6832_04148-mRNA-1:cds n=1 Tax=Sporidiobolus salmonicolor TaxID=5005 RepID=A0A0D6EQJ8_SPOSA|nr:SPOSA6832_04148 [Sporobolomyces salmonicolor]
MAPCTLCLPSQPRRAILRRPKTLQPVCKECFFEVFETEIHHTILRYGQAESTSSASKGKGKGKNVDREGAAEQEEQDGARRGLFRRGERVAIGASGGKGTSTWMFPPLGLATIGTSRGMRIGEVPLGQEALARSGRAEVCAGELETFVSIHSTVLAYIMTLLNERYDYGLDLCLLSIDEGISGYRDASLDTVKRNAEQYGLPLKILSYSELYGGWTMDRVVAEVGKKGNCTYCGVFRRQALDRGAHILTVDHIVTGHNADDVAETVLMNVLRGDISRLERCTAITTGGDPDSSLPPPASSDPSDPDSLESLLPRTIKRSKPFKYAYEKEIVMYAYFKTEPLLGEEQKLDYHSTECIYAPTAYRGYARALVKDLEAIRPSAIVDLIYSGEALAASLSLRGRRAGGDPDPHEDASNPPRKGVTKPSKGRGPLCQACMLLENLNKGVAKVDLEAGA